MKMLIYVFPLACMFFLSNAAAMGKDDAAVEKLLAACKAKVNAKIAPHRQNRINECVEAKEKKDRASCEHYYKDYAVRDVIRNNMYRDVPECAEYEKLKKVK